MNERIAKLASKAGFDVGIHEGLILGNFSDMYKIEKFAELIVNECADISDASFHDGSAGYTAILNHFGIKE